MNFTPTVTYSNVYPFKCLNLPSWFPYYPIFHYWSNIQKNIQHISKLINKLESVQENFHIFLFTFFAKYFRSLAPSTNFNIEETDSFALVIQTLHKSLSRNLWNLGIFWRHYRPNGNPYYDAGNLTVLGLISVENRETKGARTTASLEKNWERQWHPSFH